MLSAECLPHAKRDEGVTLANDLLSVGTRLAMLVPVGLSLRQFVKMHGGIETPEPLGMGSREVHWFLQPGR